MAPSTSAFLVAIFVCLLKISHEEVILDDLRSPQHIVDAWIAEQPGGAVAAALVSPEQTEYFFGGKLSPTNPALPNDQTMFELGSITKGFTALLLADQVLSGNVFLNDTISKLLTDWPGRFSATVGNVTLLELTTHTAGLPRMPDNMDDDPYVVYTKKQLYEWLDQAKLSNRGSFFYSNAGVAILGHALAVYSGKAYEQFLKERVLIPLDLKDTTITLNDQQKSRLAPGHGFTGMVVDNYPFEIMESAGAIRSSTAEMVRFLRFTTGLEDRTKRMKEALKLATQCWANKTLDSRTIGLGWMRMLLPQDKLMIYHNGATIGYNAFVEWIPERQLGVVVLASVMIFSTNTVNTLASDLLNLKLDNYVNILSKLDQTNQSFRN